MVLFRVDLIPNGMQQEEEEEKKWPKEMKWRQKKAHYLTTENELSFTLYDFGEKILCILCLHKSHMDSRWLWWWWWRQRIKTKKKPKNNTKKYACQ